MPQKPTPIIFDTDMETDCDDAGALCLLHNLQTAGLCEILAAVGDAHSDFVAPAVQTINAWFGRPNIPVGTVKIPDYKSRETYRKYREAVLRFESLSPKRLYNRTLPKGTPYEGRAMADYPDSTRTYRGVLAMAADSSVVICVVGFMSALAALLKSPPDAACPLSGLELERGKVNRVVAMAVVSPCPGKGDGNFNFRMDLPSTQFVVENLPVPLMLSCWGTSITTGERLMREAPPNHPGRMAYSDYLNADILSPPEGNRSSWDQVASVFSVLGTGPLFDIVSGYTLTVSGKEFAWMALPGGRADGYVVPKSEKKLERLVDTWMLRPPSEAEIARI